MNRSFLRGGLLCLSFIFPLLIASCSSPSRGMPDGLTSQNCPGCVHLDVYIGLYTPAYMGAFAEVLQQLPGLSSRPEGGSAESRIISLRNSDDVLVVFRKHGTFDFISHAEAMTTTGESLPVSLRTPSGDFDAVLTPRASLSKTPGLVSYDVRAKPVSGPFEPAVKVHNTGRVVLNRGASILIIQKANHGYVVWLVRADYPR